MKTSNYFAKLPQEASIKSIQTFRDYDLITLNLPAPRQRLCPCCGSTNCVIKDSGVWQTVRHLPSHHRGTAVAFHKRRLFCKECHTSFYENPYWIHPSLHMTQALYDSILLDLTEPLSFSEIARHHCVTPGIVQSVFETVRFGLPKNFRKPSVSMNSRETAASGAPKPTDGVSASITAASPMGILTR